MFPSICQPVITEKERKKTRTWNPRKICACLYFCLSLILVGPFLVFSLKWLGGESGDYPMCIIKFA